MIIYMLPSLGVEHSCKELPVANHVIQSSSNELSIPVAVKRICKERENNAYA